MNAKSTSTTALNPRDDAPRLTAELAARAQVSKGDVILREASPPLARGRPPKLPQDRKQQVTIRLSRDLLETLRATGEGWQTRVDEVLRAVFLGTAASRLQREANANLERLTDELNVDRYMPQIGMPNHEGRHAIDMRAELRSDTSLLGGLVVSTYPIAALPHSTVIDDGYFEAKMTTAFEMGNALQSIQKESGQFSISSNVHGATSNRSHSTGRRPKKDGPVAKVG